MGFFPRLYAGDPEMLADPTGKTVVRHDPGGWESRRRRGGRGHHRLFPEQVSSGPGITPWQSRPIGMLGTKALDAAEKYNKPGKFTAFIGYEWTSNTGGMNLHRVVIFRDDANKAALSSPTPHWRHWAATTRETCGIGCRRTKTKRGVESSHRPQRQSVQRHHVSDRGQLLRQCHRS